MKVLLVRAIYWFQGLFENPAELFESLGVERADHVLEIGCAIGYHTLPLGRIASEGKVYAVDVWEEGLAHLRRRAVSMGNIEVINGSGEAVELPEASLDWVVCFDTLHELVEPDVALQRWTRFLKKDGKLLCRDPIIPLERIGRLSGQRLRHVKTVQEIGLFVRYEASTN